MDAGGVVVVVVVVVVVQPTQCRAVPVVLLLLRLSAGNALGRAKSSPAAYHFQHSIGCGDIRARCTPHQGTLTAAVLDTHYRRAPCPGAIHGPVNMLSPRPPCMIPSLDLF